MNNKINNVSSVMELRNSEVANSVIVVGSGSSIVKHKTELTEIINDYNCTVIGVNYMTELRIPEYHVWTNYKQFINYKSCISDQSKLILGEKLSKKVKNMKHYIVKHRSSKDIKITDNIIHGNFRTCGVLSIMLAHIFGASLIFVAGMDGYTYCSKKILDKKQAGQHWYGKGFTDDASWKKCVKKDEEVYKQLRQIKEFGVNFSIITPTVFSDFYNPF